MILISHRGNINGRDTENENHPSYIDLALGEGYDVEVDVWLVDDKLYLGHDKPQYQIELSWLKERCDNLWVHCKNIEALIMLLDEYRIHTFWHENDAYTLTSNCFVWTYPNKPMIKSESIAVLPELFPDWDLKNFAGICSDIIEKYKS